jgi:hypothetical protein
VGENGGKIMKMIGMIGFCLLVLLPVTQSFAGDKYMLAWWREWGMYENGGPGGGNHSIHVWVFDENGNIMPGVDVYTSWGVLQGTTSSEGRCEIPIYPEHDRDVRIGAPGVVDSDVTPLMTTARWPNWGHYSYDCGFMYKADASQPGEFDQSLWGTVNVRDGDETDCPYTKSLVYNSIDWQDTYSDQFWLGNWSSSFAQTFQATEVDRIVGVMLQGTIGGNDILTWTAQIREGGPTGPVIFSKSTPFDIFPFRYFIPFGVNDCPVVAGQTYAVTLSRPGGLNSYHVANVYNNGQYYEVTTAYPSYDLAGFVVGMMYWQPGTGLLRGTVQDSLGQPLRGAAVSTSPGDYSDETNLEGEYSIWSVPEGFYDVTAAKEGYNSQTMYEQEVVAGQTTITDFTLSSSLGTISGVVSTIGGFPIEGAFVQTSPGGYGAVTDTNGFYDIINIVSGTYDVTAYAPMRIEVTETGKVVSAGATTTVNFALSRSGKVAYLWDDFNGNYIFIGDWLEESFNMGIGNHEFFGTTDPDLKRPPHNGTDSAQEFSLYQNNDQYVSYFETKDPVTESKNFNLVQYAAAHGWQPIDVSQPITYIIYVKGHNDAFDPDDPDAHWRQRMGIHRPELYVGEVEIFWNEANNDTWQMLKASVTGLMDDEKQWVTFENWYPPFYGSMIYERSWTIWENLVIEYTPLGGMTPGDFDGDGDVDFADYGALANHWMNQNCTEPDWCGGTDLNQSGSVDWYDLAEFVEYWLEPGGG